jgi:[ribosomal protein S18]-alanine N-acetyltransferase
MSVSGIFVRSAEMSDLQRLLSLAESCHGAPRWPPRTWQQVLESHSAGPARVVLIAESVNECVGFGVLGLAGDDAEIESLAVSTSWRRRGIARRLCKELFGWASARGARSASLEVRVSNTAARELYDSLGFRQVAVRRDYYRDPQEDALVMTAELWAIQRLPG